jgi:23S rRNA pseudouridine1911/1915/1917 synthase
MLRILYQDNHIIAVNKHCGDLVQGDKTGDQSLDILVREYLKKKYNKPGNVFLGVVHRLDRPVSGVVLFARTSKALSRLNSMFRDSAIQKKYWAVVKNKPIKKTAILKHYIYRKEKINKSFSHDKMVPGAKEASLTYRLSGTSDNFYLLDIELHTGRHHQIRSQLAKIGCPIRGDLKYGFDRSNKDGGISLHARSVELIHPVSKKNIVIIADPPDDPVWNFFLSNRC